jgi:hypothetical protein
MRAPRSGGDGVTEAGSAEAVPEQPLMRQRTPEIG